MASIQRASDFGRQNGGGQRLTQISRRPTRRDGRLVIARLSRILAPF